MISKISEGVKIDVDTSYQPEYSNPIQSEFLFSYKITITNNNNFPIKLLRRHWFIIDSNCIHKEVEGEGVVGVQPIINPFDTYQYISACNLKSELGKMHGNYQFENLQNNQLFFVEIPEFILESPFKLN
jgi:ApaG protein